MNKSWLDNDREPRKPSELNRIRKLVKQAETIRLSAGGSASSKYAEKGAWLTQAGRVFEEYEAKGYRAVVASVVFHPYTKRVSTTHTGTETHRINERQAETITKTLLSTFDDMYGGRRGKQVNRLVFRQTGKAGDNSHYHITFFVPPAWDLEEFYARWVDAKNKVISKALEGVYADSMRYKKGNEWFSTFEKLALSESINEAPRQADGKYYSLYSVHEVRKTLDSFQPLLSAL